MNRVGSLATLGVLTLITPGCATIVSGKHATVALQSTPPNASVTVRNQEGSIVQQTMTPAEVTLPRKRKWGQPASYTATFEKPGYHTVQAPLNAKFNPWSLGNIVLGGPLGLGVDTATGAIWRPESDRIARTLPPLAGAVAETIPSADRSGEVHLTAAEEDQ